MLDNEKIESLVEDVLEKLKIKELDVKDEPTPYPNSPFRCTFRIENCRSMLNLQAPERANAEN